MKSIQIHRFKSTGLQRSYGTLNSIEIEDRPFSEGAFGEVYNCHSVNGLPSSVPQIIKIFKEKNPGDADHNYLTIKRLQDKLNKKNQELQRTKGDSLLQCYPALKGVPQFSFEGHLNGKKVRGFSADNLKSLGFVEFKDILEKEQLLSKYQKLAIDQKLLIGYHFVSAFKVLRDFYFIHADIKPEAIFVNTHTNECAIIDFDSGVITEHPDDEPNTWGAANDWVAPEIWDQLKNQTSLHQKIQVDLYTDAWSIMIGVHYFLTTVHPLFFLKELSPKVIRQYFGENQWPNTKKSWYFNQDYSTVYSKYFDWISNHLPVEIKNGFAQSINYGYQNPIQRTSYDGWQQALKAVQQPPVFNRVEINRSAILTGMDCNIRWDVSNAHTVIINNNIGKVATSGSISVTPQKDTTYQIKAIGHYGEAIENLAIRVFPTPVLESLLVPVPEFSQRVDFKPLQISTPEIDFSIKYQPNIYSEKTDFSMPPIEWPELNTVKKKYTPFLVLSNLYYEFKRKIFGR